MPLYAFECSECGQPFEALVTRPSADAKEPCPACGSAKVERTIGLPSRPTSAAKPAANANCGEGPPCGASWCGRKPLG